MQNLNIMTKKKKSKQVKAKEAVIKLPTALQVEANPGFGGLPERDLKKNLGCG
jgi:hypothetical protein